MSDVAHLKSLLGVHPDFPKKGITFLDIFPLMRDPYAFESLITHLVHHITTTHTVKPDVIVGLDARGFLLGPIIAMRLGAAFVPVRKGGKLPGQVDTVAYEKEYGVDEFQMQKGAVQARQKCIVVDDLIATGGSAAAAGQLIKSAGGSTLEYLFIISLPFLNGADRLDAPVYAMIEAED
ncbi:putative adenine phosphoribosyltransferase [Dioszegia hungarica]|uniref:adenine phosphoribosyltransferase n=1 Tax=Dioszegia hungarica TaxID=4972 RepID=A0AA38LVP0_9TREE|nr:putative adenine phosphoribosyltransferase [Dioszegia hungarica]KAI9635566.1 putative adenine phosphoribosyltransferase [Dioszegia hungarica]